MADSRLFKKLYGEDQDGGYPYGLRLLYEAYAKGVKAPEKQGDQSGERELRKIMVAFNDAEIQRLTKLEKILKTNDQLKMRYVSAALLIRGQQASERLMRYEAHLSREIDGILNRLPDRIIGGPFPV